MNLSTLLDPNGYIRIAAFDHRDSLKKYVSEENFPEFKKLLTVAFKDYISGILVDPFYGQQSIEAAERNNTAVILSREESGYTDNPDGRTTTLTELNAEKLKEYGATAIKLLLYFNPSANNADQQLEILKSVHSECESAEMPLLVEPITYPIPNHEYKKSREILTTINLIKDYADILKIEYPLDDENGNLEIATPDLYRITQILGDKPWILLSRGAMDFERFHRAVELCIQNGAKGYAVGRAIWQEIATLPTWEEKSNFIKTTGVERMHKLSLIR